jgi:hypothetical protein
VLRLAASLDARARNEVAAGSDQVRLRGEVTSYLHKELDRHLRDVRGEVLMAVQRFPSFNSPHEGKAVIEEELEELWEHVKANTGRSMYAMDEARQIAAMAIRYMLDLDERTLSGVEHRG